MDKKLLHRARKKLFSLLNLKTLFKSRPSSSNLDSNPTNSIPTLSDKEAKTTTGIEALPFELKLAILHAIPNLQILKRLLRASPGCYRAFQSSKRKVLKAVIQNELSPSLLVEAIAVCKAKGVSREEEWIVSVYRVARDWKNEKTAVEERIANGEENKSRDLEEDSVIEIANLCVLVQGLTDEFCSDVFYSREVHEGDAQKIEWIGEISDMERHRIQRAMYRFEIFVALFGEKGFKPNHRPENFRGREMADLCFGNDGMRAWEVEELGCVRDWMYRVYGGMLKEVKELIWKMDVESERDELRCFMKEGKEMEQRARKQVIERSKSFRLG
jgi:hypothetical protein